MGEELDERDGVVDGRRHHRLHLHLVLDRLGLDQR